MFNRCVCFGLVFISDDDLSRTFILPYGTLSSADASNLLISINRRLRVDLNPSIYGRAARLYTECTHPRTVFHWHSPFSQMYVRAAAERSLFGTPMHLLLVDAPNSTVHINGMFHARLEPLRAFVSLYPMDGILRASEKCGRPVHRILSDTTSAFTDQLRLCQRKHCSLQHYPCFRAMINLQPRTGIRRPWCYSSRATGTPVAPTANSKLNVLLSAPFWPFSELLRSPFHRNLPLPAWFWPSGDFLSQTTLARFFLWETTEPILFGQLQHGLTFSRSLSQGLLW